MNNAFNETCCSLRIVEIIEKQEASRAVGFYLSSRLAWEIYDAKCHEIVTAVE